MISAAIDHLVYACPELDEAIDDIAADGAVRAAPGGQHPGQGTRNALLGLGPRCYLELIGPDPAQPPPAAPLPFGLDGLRAPALRGWAVAPADLDAAIRAARAAGADPGQPLAGLRRGPDGTSLRWRMTPARETNGLAIAPFLIDWDNSPHPAAQAPPGLVLTEFVVRTPEPAQVTPLLDALGLRIRIQQAPEAGLRAVLLSAAGKELILAS